MKAITLLLALLLTGTARAQSIAIPRSYSEADSHPINGAMNATVNVLANGERWVILHGQNDLGIQIMPGMPVGSTGQFQTNMVRNVLDSSVESSIVGDCQKRTYEIMSNVVFDGTYRTGKGDEEPSTLDHDLHSVLPGTDMDYVFAVACGDR